MLVTVQKCVKNMFFYLNEEARQSRRRTGSRRTFLFYLFLTLSFVPHFQVLAAPTSLTYQGRILKTDGTPLEYNNVGFIFQITNPSGGCILYQEQVSGYDMTNSGGVFDVPIGEGTISYPLGGGFTVTDTFNNSSTFTCGSCSGYTCANGSGTYSPAVNDGRRLRVQFYDGSGWRTISPDNVIRSVPFAAYSMSAQKLGNKVVEDFMLKAGLPTCGAGTFLTWNGTTMSCASVAGASGGTVTDVTSANSYLSVANGTSTPTLTLNVGTGAGTVAAGNDSRITGALQSGAAAGGSLSGTYPNPGIANNAVTSATINDGAITTTKALTTNPGINRIVGTDGTTGASLSKMECSTVGHVLSWTVATGFQCNAISSLYTAPVTSVAGKTGVVSLVSADISDATDVNTANMLVKRDASGNFSAGTISSTGLVAGTLQVTGGTPASGKVLTSDATGNATWQSPSVSQWITSGSNIYYNIGNVGIGTTTPVFPLEVTGDIGLSAGAARTIKVADVTASNGDSLTISGGTVSSLSAYNGGSLSLLAGNGSYSGTGGALVLKSGIGGAAGLAGAVTLAAATSNQAGVPGAVNVTGSNNSWGAGGVINITAGSGANALNGGNVYLNGGSVSGGGSYGNVIMANSGGKVGIGTATPQSRLDIKSSSSSSTAFRILTSTGVAGISSFETATNNSVLYINNNSATSMVRLSSTSSWPSYFLGGYVGIGTSKPASKLTVTQDVAGGNTFSSGTSDFVNDPVFGTYTGSALTLSHGATTGNTYSTIQASMDGGTTVGSLALNPSGGNVGIGTTSPGALLDVNGTMRVNQICDSTGANCKTVSGGWNATSGFSSLSAATSTGTIDNTNFAQTWNWSSATTENPMTITANSLTTGSLMSLTSSSASINSTNGLLNVANTSAATTGVVARIQSNSTAGSGLTVLADGNVGIGTTTPGTLLELKPTSNGTDIFHILNSSGTAVGVFAATAGGHGDFIVKDSSGNNRINLAGTGSVSLKNTTAVTNVYLDSNGLSSYINGKVGIGTTAPAAVLDILGTSAGTGSASASKVLNIVGGAGGTTGGNGGGVSITGGNATVYTGGVGGSLSFTAGNGSNGGNVTFTSGTAIFAGTGSSIALGGGGSGGNGGTVTITSGNGGNGAAPGGTINITAGNGSGGGPAQNGGPINITAGGGATGGSGASVTINGGAKNGAGSDGNVVLANLRGNVGIGTTSPTKQLEVMDGSVGVDVYGVSGNGAGYVMSKGGDLALGVNGSNSIVLYSDGNVSLPNIVSKTTGNVGIGTTTPAATLDINGTAKLKKYAAEPNACDATHDGQLALTSVYTTCVCNGTSWVKTSDGSTVCAWF